MSGAVFTVEERDLLGKAAQLLNDRAKGMPGMAARMRRASQTITETRFVDMLNDNAARANAKDEGGK